MGQRAACGQARGGLLRQGGSVSQSVSERLRKQHACEQAADEAVLLAESLTQARRDGYRIDWQALAGGGSISGGDFTLRVTAAGDYLHLPDRKSVV